jgi:uncharacterized membrane protein YfcA
MQIYLPIAELALSGLLLLGMGLAVGFLSGMFGIGGGFIMTPLLIFLGVPSAVAVGTGASQVMASSVSSAVGHWQRGNVDLQMGYLLIGGGLFGAVSGVRIVYLLKQAGQLDFFVSLTYVVLLGVIGALMLIESARTLTVTRAKVATSVRRAGQHTWVQRLPLKRRFPDSKLYISAIPPVAIGAFVGWLTAIMGVGGGFVMVPAMIYLLRMPTRMVIGTSAFQIVVVTALTTVLQSMQNHSVDVMLALPLIVGGVVGAQYGVSVSERLKAEQLRAGLALLVLAVAVRMALGLVVQPGDYFSLEAAPTQ